MSGLNPTGPAQPSNNQAYNTAGNPASKEPAEQTSASQPKNDETTGRRVPQEQSTSINDATPTSMARGIRGGGPGEDPSKLKDQDRGLTADVDAEQMGAPGEGRVKDAVDNKPGAGGNQPGLETDLDRKKAEQAPLRQEMKKEKEHEVDVGGILGQRGGPASTVD